MNFRVQFLDRSGAVIATGASTGQAAWFGCEFSTRTGARFTGKWSEWRDSNPRPLVPQTSALTGLRYTPTDAFIGKWRAHDNAFCRKMAIELTPIAPEREFARLPANLRAVRARRQVRRFPVPVWASGPALGARRPSRRAGEARSAHAAPSEPVAAWRPGRARSS